MNRRNFLKRTAYAPAGFIASRAVGNEGLRASVAGSTASTPNSTKIGYIRDNIPRFEIPRYIGESYRDRVPDTFDIAERARLGVHALTAIADPAADYEIWGAADFFRNPATMLHDFNDWVQNQEGFMEALPLLRIATGESLNDQVDPVWMQSTLRSIGPDGLLYIPLAGRPWGRLNADGVNPVWKKAGTTTNFKDPTVTQFANVSTCQRMIGTMTIYYLRDKNPIWKSTIEAMIRRLKDIAIDRGDYCYYAAGSFEPNARVDPQAPMPTGSLWGVSWNSRLIQGLAQYYRATGDPEALGLAHKLTNYAVRHSEVFDAQGRWLLDPEFRGKQGFPDFAVPDWVRAKYGRKELHFGGHSHGHMIALLGLIELGAVTRNRELLEFGKSSFEWSKSPGSDYGVSTLVGWFPEFYVPGYPSADADPQGDMIAMALKLSDAGLGDYWDDIDRWVRNQFAEQQVTDPTALQALSERSKPKPLAAFESADHVAKRSVGAYGSSVSGNDWALGVASTGIAQCCTGTNTRTIYYVWDRMIDYSDSEVRVNLLINRASPWVDVYSHIPFEGRVDLKLKRECRNVRLRAPEWIASSSPELTVFLNGHSLAANWSKRYIDLGAGKPGDRFTMKFPISERTVKERIGPVTYTLVIRGNTVVSIDPKGSNVPLYANRSRYRTGQASWREVSRFVSTESIRW